MSAINQEGFNSFARHFIHFFEPDRIKKNIINPKSAKRGHLTHIQFFLLSLYYRRTKYNLIEEKIDDDFFYFSQNGIIPLIWAELKYCLEHNIYINRCAICHRYYTTDRLSLCCYDEKCKRILKSRTLSESKEQKAIRNRKNYNSRKQST